MTDVIHSFTRVVPEWKPRVKPIDLKTATKAQLEALEVTPSDTKVSDYVLTLAHDVESLKVRSPLFNAIMYDKGGLSRAERELGAMTASIVNRCIYCTAVHASRYTQLQKSHEIADSILEDGLEAKLNPRNKAIFDFAVKLSKCPPQVDEDDLSILHEVGLTKEEILDLILSVSLFGWANRLMHVLGDPIRREDNVE
ncbi:MAG: alkylhydroperoxidase [Rhodospirillaceae bacterium]|nr:alkylhydroperoxidase [Rhodospirillaceae bacterium]|tara:strand:+ start:2308 stop:2898 length:591 start_codon:yes stop_codon:yes gene_type:complete